jgi:hypothetical protein
MLKGVFMARYDGPMTSTPISSSVSFPTDCFVAARSLSGWCMIAML